MTKTAKAQKQNKDAGFSLVELLIAVVILAIIVIPLMNLFVSSNRINIKSRQTLRATTAAQDIMEGLKAYNIEEIKEQFKDPASGFYVIDSRLIKGGVEERTDLEVDPSGNPADGLYVFSMKDLTMQGSEYDAKIEVDGRGYMTGTSTHDNEFNAAALADARSIDKKNGTFVEEEKYRQAALASVFKDGDVKNDIENKLRAAGVSDAMLLSEFQKVQDAVHYTNLSTFFENYKREIEIELSVSGEVDENGDPKADMAVTQTYYFTYKLASGTTKTVDTKGDMGSVAGVVDHNGCGNIAKTKDDKINVNLFYYPLYGASDPDLITIKNNSGYDLNLLIAKQRHETTDEHGMPVLSDPEYLSDPQLMAAEQTYKAKIDIQEAHFDADAFSLKTNLGLNLVGQKYMGGTSIDLPTQFSVTAGTGITMSGLNIFTLDGVRSALGKAGTPGEVTELIYDVQVSIYKTGAADSGFPEDMRMVVIGGSTTN